MILDFPQEIIFHIVQNLDSYSYFNLIGVCSELRSLIVNIKHDDRNSCFYDLYLQHLAIQNPKLQAKLILKNYNLVKSASLKYPNEINHIQILYYLIKLDHNVYSQLIKSMIKKTETANMLNNGFNVISGIWNLSRSKSDQNENPSQSSSNVSMVFDTLKSCADSYVEKVNSNNMIQINKIISTNPNIDANFYDLNIISDLNNDENLKNEISCDLFCSNTSIDIDYCITKSQSHFPAFTTLRLSPRSDLTVKFVKDHASSWHFDKLARVLDINHILNLEATEENDKLRSILVDFANLPYNKSLTLDYVIRNLDENWDWSILTYHSMFTLALIEEYITTSNPIMSKLNPVVILMKPEMTLDFALKHISIWKRSDLNSPLNNIYSAAVFYKEESYEFKHDEMGEIISEYNRQAKINLSNFNANSFGAVQNFVSNLGKFNFNKSNEAENFVSDMTMRIITIFASARWGTIADIENHPELKWSYNLLSFNTNMNIDYVFENLHKSWDSKFLSMNPSINPSDYVDLPLEITYDNISQNCGLTWWFIYQNLDKEWDIEAIFANRFNYGNRTKLK